MKNPTKTPVNLFVAGLSHKTAPVALREQLAVSPTRLRCSACRCKIAGDLSEAVLLSTCNRVELYGVTPRRYQDAQAYFRHLGSGDSDLSEHVYLHEDEAAVRHLFSVASGLDSLVLGETEILGQVKQAYAAAQEAKLTGRLLNRLFQTALQTAKEVRTHTQVGRGSTSVGSVAVDLAEKIFSGDLSARTVMILGAGKMGETCVRHLAKSGARSVVVCNRSLDRATALAAGIGGRAIRFEDRFAAMAETDIVVSSTGCPTTVLKRADMERILALRRNRPLVLIDIAVPRDIDPEVQQLGQVYLYNIDDLETLVRENLRHREQELARCRAIVEERTAALMARLAPVESQPACRPQNRPAAAWGLESALAGCS